MRLNAVIFDLDGTVVSDEDEWGLAFKKVLHKLGVQENSAYPHIGGIGIEENWPIFIKKYNIRTDKNVDELTLETKTEFEKLIGKIELKKGFETFVEELRDSGIKTALATSSSWSIVEKIVESLGIEGYFDCVTTGEEVVFKKPDPEIFKIAADKLDVMPANCLVFEDSKAGVTAAHEAGMKVVAMFRDERHKNELRKADLLVKNFEEVGPKAIEGI